MEVWAKITLFFPGCILQVGPYSFRKTTGTVLFFLGETVKAEACFFTEINVTNTYRRRGLKNNDSDHSQRYQKIFKNKYQHCSPDKQAFLDYFPLPFTLPPHPPTLTANPPLKAGRASRLHWVNPADLEGGDSGASAEKRFLSLEGGKGGRLSAAN